MATHSWEATSNAATARPVPMMIIAVWRLRDGKRLQRGDARAANLGGFPPALGATEDETGGVEFDVKRGRVVPSALYCDGRHQGRAQLATRPRRS